MARTIIVGLDGSRESQAAAEWAAREAVMRRTPIRLLHVWQPVPDPMAQAPLLGAETHQHWTERVPRESAEGLRLRHPGVQVTTEQRTGTPAEALLDAAEGAELLVLGSRGLSGLAGFLIGSVGQSVVARAEVPVILVRAGEQAADEHVQDPAGIPSAATAFRPVVLGLDTDSPHDTVITFAFEEARRRKAPLSVVTGWKVPPYYFYALATGVDPREEFTRERAAELAEVLLPWREKYPEVEVTETCGLGSPAVHLVDAAQDSSLVVVGRRIRRSPLGAHIGAVTHAVMHHATAPVAVVAHD
ncbi:universal stress protein [Streptomyces sp. TRM66268-LWL]|uniref:Universal stress protein n=1 Tax=Streptomyces polyasparticus TaxID=2767826 RepID=A0ABR7SMH2_9ACTN|nr:universal stress protein [Streptomyces polyasparticus]MBC9716049.1 universal stress protein [Streptomyces polyasparticus]